MVVHREVRVLPKQGWLTDPYGGGVGRWGEAVHLSEFTG